MSRYAYNRQVMPPAPFVHVTVRDPSAFGQVADLPAQLDTAADRTVMPQSVVEQLGLAALGLIWVQGLGGAVRAIPSFAVQIEIRGLARVSAEVVADPQEPFVLLGRDVLNHFYLELDGPRLTLEIT